MSRFPERLPDEDTDSYFKRAMNKELAEAIKRFRVTEGRTWRGVGACVHEAFPDLGIKPVRWDEHERWVSQLDGAALCSYAMEFLGEKTEDGWN